MTELSIMVGIPASGKSTVARHWLQEDYVHAIVSSDEVRRTLTGSAENFNHEKLVWGRVAHQLRNHLEVGRNVVLDATNLIPMYRRPWLDIGNEFEIPVFAYRHDIDFLEAVERNAKRERVVPDEIMDKMWANWSRYCSLEQLDAEGFTAFDVESEGDRW